MSNQFNISTGQQSNKLINSNQQASTRTAANTFNTNNSNSPGINNNNIGLVNKHLAAVTGSHTNATKLNTNSKRNDQTQSDSSNSFIRQVSLNYC